MQPDDLMEELLSQIDVKKDPMFETGRKEKIKPVEQKISLDK